MRVMTATRADEAAAGQAGKQPGGYWPAAGPAAQEGHAGHMSGWRGNPPGTSGSSTHPGRQVHAQPPEQATAGGWPLSSHLELGALPGAVACARLHARLVLWEWGLSSVSENAELLVSELVTNAVEASHSGQQIPPVRLRLSSDRSRLLIQVEDTSRYPPSPASADDGERGRGLLIVDAISTKWGWDTKNDHSGKIVWALME